jgi:subtilase family serine protease
MKKLAVLLAVLALPMMAFAGSVNVNFTDAGFTTVTTQYLATDGVSFSNALELTTGDGDIGPGTDYPLPPNGSNVITNDPADPLAMNITSQGALAGNYVYSLSGYYTSPIGITITAFNSVGGVLATLVLGANDGVATLFTLSIPGCTGASFSAACAIASITFSDGGAPDTLTLGELTLSDAPTPEPGTLALFGSGLVGLVGFLRRRRKLSVTARQATPALLGLLVFVLTFAGALRASDRALITQPIDEHNRVTLAGNTRPEALNPKNDRGPVADSFEMKTMLLQLKRSPQLEKSLNKFLDDIQDPKSGSYHKFLTIDEFAERFGAPQSDIDTVTNWLTSHGFQIDGVFPGTLVIAFTGNAGQIRDTFGTEIHNLEVKGESHYANIRDPQIPTALASRIEGIVSMHNFLPHKMLVTRQAHGNYSDGNADFPFVVEPSDLATIYNYNPVFTTLGITGKGQTVVVIEDTNVYNPPCQPNVTNCTTPLATSDWVRFRTDLGLGKYTSATFTEINPGGSVTCPAPSTGTGTPAPGTGVNTDSVEAALDVEWASASAPNANIVNAACGSTATFGGLIAIENIVNSAAFGSGAFATCPGITLSNGTKTPDCVLSMSYGEDEARTGATENALFNTTFGTGAALGMSLFVSSGDEGAASRDANTTVATHGITVTGWGSSPNVVSVGGTDFLDGATGTTATYWNSYNNVFFGSAKGYIPEIPWNDSCAGLIYDEFLFPTDGNGTPYGSTGLCNAFTSTRLVAGGSGGPSGCATGAASTSGVVSGSCQGWPKPTYQLPATHPTLPGLTNDGVRDLPDVSLFASNGWWGHYYVYCFSETNASFGGATCTGLPTGDSATPTSGNWSGAGGTSFSSPITAGIFALVTQFKNAPQGNPDARLYTLAANGGTVSPGPYGSSVANCSSYGPNGSCIFYDVSKGDFDVNCTTRDCYIPSGTDGALSTGPVVVTTQPTCTACTAATTFSCTVAGPGNLGPYNNTVNGLGASFPTVSYAGGVQATCTVASTATSVLTVTVTNGGAGYAPDPIMTVAITGGPGTMKAQPVTGVTTTPASGYQPAYGAITGWDFTTGIGTINVNNLVKNW